MIEKIGFFSPLSGVGKECGYGYAAYELITAWQRMGIPVWAYDREAPVAFNFGQPHFYERVKGKLNIGYTPWESNHVPEAWIKYMNLMDEIWTPCEANADWYRDAGVEVPVRVLHHGLNRNHFPLVKRVKRDDEPFKFLHIGEPAQRKGGQMAYEVFRDVFGDRDDVHLTLKGKPRFDVEGDNVTVIRTMLDMPELTQLHLDNHFMIYPTNGEGFGFIPFQGAATGMPTAVTNWSGPVDYMDHCYPIEVEALVEPDYIPHEGLWALPSRESLGNWMESFIKHPHTYFTDAYLKSQDMDAYWSWDNIAKTAVEFITDSLN